MSGLFNIPASPRACFVFAHGAGAGMRHAFMESVAQGLEAHSIATYRYQFPYMDKGSMRTDPPAICHKRVREAVAEARERMPGVPLVAGGKSFGGRMTSQAQGLEPLPDVKGLAFFGFPLHPAKKPSDERAAHLADVKIPMLFLQGTRDELAEMRLLEPVVNRLGTRATLRKLEGADHSFHVLARSGRNDREVLEEMLNAFSTWLDAMER